jgi:hypothetical protein
MLKNGNIENTLMIFDLNNNSIMSTPHSKLKAILGAVAG